MNKDQIDKLYDIFVEVIMDDNYTRPKAPFTYKLYSSKDSKKIVIKCNSVDDLIMFYTIDYEKQQYLPDCYGLNVDDTLFYLNCEMERHQPTIFYTLDERLSIEFNNRFTS